MTFPMYCVENCGRNIDSILVKYEDEDCFGVIIFEGSPSECRLHRALATGFDTAAWLVHEG